MAEETINEAVLKELKAAAKEATSGVLYAHKLRSTAGVVSYDLGTSKHFDPDGDGESIAEVYHEWDATYFVAANPRVVLALIAALETVRGERDALRAALEFVGNYASVEFDDHNGTTPRGRIRRMCAMALNGKPLTAEMLSDQYPLDDTAALNTQPQAEWTPRFRAGQLVTLHAGDERAQIVATYVDNRIDKYLVRWLDNDEIETRFDSELTLYTEGIVD